MITFAHSKEMISCWVEAGKPLDSETIAVINEVQSEIDELDRGYKWLVFEGQCRICNYTQNIMCPSSNDIDNQECYNCGNDTMMEKETPEWELP